MPEEAKVVITISSSFGSAGEGYTAAHQVL